METEPLARPSGARPTDRMQSLTGGPSAITTDTRVDAPTDHQPESKLRRGLTLAAEMLLILVIVGLLVAIWLPGWIGPHPGITR